MSVVRNHTALLAYPEDAAQRWNNPFALGTGAVVTYRFLADRALPSTGELAYRADGAVAFDAAQQGAFRQAAAKMEARADLRFVEVEAPAMIEIHGVIGSDWGGWANYPWSSEWGSESGDLVIDLTRDRSLRDTGDQELLLHELGHAVGLKHPHEGDVSLAADLDTQINTVMSYEFATREADLTGALKRLDAQALAAIYGDDQDSARWRIEDLGDRIKIVGTGGADSMIGPEAALWMQGRAGRDLLAGREQDDRLAGGGGDDTLVGRGGEDTLFGGDGDDRLHSAEIGDGGYDRGADRLVGGRGDDRLWGAAGDDVLGGQGGADTLKGAGGYDRLYGNAGDDRLIGGDGADLIWGGDGDDVLFGYEGQDRMAGGRGDDLLWGGSGQDILAGGAGDDTLIGGEDSDTFRFTSADRGGRDEVRGFVLGDDLLDLRLDLGAGGMAIDGVASGSTRVSFAFLDLEVTFRDVDTGAFHDVYGDLLG